MAKTHGLDSFGQVEGIRYTFNVERPGANVSRSWEWNPKTDSVSYEGKDKDGKPVKVTYHRSQATGVPEDIDANFLNDQYWLLLPFHVERVFVNYFHLLRVDGIQSITMAVSGCRYPRPP